MFSPASTLAPVKVRSVSNKVVCWEALVPKGKALRQARRIYKASLPADERIPWSWIKEGLTGERIWHPERWGCHLLLAGWQRPDREERRVVGFAYGAHIPGFGGYGGYLGVEPSYRGHGIGARLWRLLIQRLQLDAACAGVDLPFVLWESRPPEPEASADEQATWQARLRLWASIGAWTIEGVQFQAPNYADPDGPPVPLQLFLLPLELPPAAFDPVRLRGVVTGLQRFVYSLAPDHPLGRAAWVRGALPTLRPLSGSR